MVTSRRGPAMTYILVSVDESGVRLLDSTGYDTRKDALAALGDLIQGPEGAQLEDADIYVVDVEQGAPVVLMESQRAREDDGSEAAGAGDIEPGFDLPVATEMLDEIPAEEPQDEETEVAAAAEEAGATETVEEGEPEVEAEPEPIEEEPEPVEEESEPVEPFADAMPPETDDIPEPPVVTEGFASDASEAEASATTESDEPDDTEEEPELDLVDALHVATERLVEEGIEAPDNVAPAVSQEPTPTDQPSLPDDDLEIDEIEHLEVTTSAGAVADEDRATEAVVERAWPWEIEAEDAQEDELEAHDAEPETASEESEADEPAPAVAPVEEIGESEAEEPDAEEVPEEDDEPPKAYEPGVIDMDAYTCDDCVYDATCPKKGDDSPATCGSFQWKSS
jgi:pilus assembly protein FimV